MGILGQMISQDLTNKFSSEKNPGPRPKEKLLPSVRPTPVGSLRPEAPCSKCRSLQFWLDAYGQWHCGGCEPPAVLAMIRQDHTIDPNAEVIEVNGEKWIRRQNFRGQWGWELVNLIGWRRQLARTDFDDLPDLEIFPRRSKTLGSQK